MNDIHEIKRRLNDRVAQVAEMLLPNGRREGHEWRVGSVEGERGKSLGVHLTGEKAGVWQDFSAGVGGDLLDLWCRTRRIALAQAIEEARAYVGLISPEPHRDSRPSYTRPKKPACTAPKARVRDYLVEVRAIPDAILAKYQVGEAGSDIVFPFKTPSGELALVKRRKAEDGASPTPTEANCEPVLFGWQAVPENAREIILTEGEIDALSWAAYGYAAMSVPFGGGKGGKQKWIENEFERMARFERIYISTDMDEPGHEAAAEIASRLGRHRCYRVTLPHKDANECLMSGVSQDVMTAALASAQGLDPDGLKRAGAFVDDVTRLFYPDHAIEEGYTTPYGTLAGKLVFRPGEITVWSGDSGHGKSQILSDCAVHWIRQGARVCLSSLEMKAAVTLKRMVKQASDSDRPTKEYIAEIMAWLDSGLILYDRVGKVGALTLVEVFDYARAKYGCDMFAIDSLMRLNIETDDYNAQEKTVYELVDWAISRNVHLHLVAHSRKGGSDRGVPETGDVKGAMEIGANAFNILTVWRNKKLEDQIKAAQTDEERERLEQKAGVLLNIAKQRNGDFEGKIGLWFDVRSYRYRSSASHMADQRTYVDYSGALL